MPAPDEAYRINQLLENARKQQQDSITFQERISLLRKEIKLQAENVKQQHKHKEFESEQSYVDQHGEMHANLTLAYRHLEDAAMRLGKVIQAYDGGTSVYDK